MSSIACSRLAVSAWAEREANPFFTTLFGTVMRFAPPAAAPPADAPGPLRLAEPGALEATLHEAGFRDVTVRKTPMVYALDSVEDHYTIVSELAAPVEALVRSLPDDELARFRAALPDAIAPFVGDGGRVRIPGLALCASAVR